MARSKAARSAGATASERRSVNAPARGASLLVNGAAGRGQRQKGFAQIVAVGAAREELAFLKLGDGT